MRNVLSVAELEAEHTELLPTRETLTYSSSNWAAVYASNSSLAFNAATLDSWANSEAEQTIYFEQG